MSTFNFFSIKQKRQRVHQNLQGSHIASTALSCADALLEIRTPNDQLSRIYAVDNNK